jgi:hypothetical protein
MAGLLTISAKVTQETADQFTTAFEASGCETKNQFYELILERYLNPKTKPVEVARPTSEQLQEIQLKDNEIGRLKSAYGLEAAQVEAMGEECRLLNQQLNDAKEQIAALSNTPPEPGTEKEPLPKEQVLVTLSPIMSVVLDIESELASKRNKQEVSRAQILENCFYATIDEGRYNPHRLWSQSELRQLAKQLKEVELQQ